MWLRTLYFLIRYSDFYSHIPCGMWRQAEAHTADKKHFYSHIPCGMWRQAEDCRRMAKISTHTSRVGCDRTTEPQKDLAEEFLLTHPVWDVTHHSPLLSSGLWFLLTHPVWDVTCLPQYSQQYVQISTHTSRVGCDVEKARQQSEPDSNFYSHIPCGMWLSRGIEGGLATLTFLLTHPVWDVTLKSVTALLSSIFLLTHPVWDVTAIYSIFQSHYSHILQDGPIIHLELY